MKTELTSWNGVWWLPEAPDSRQPGILTRDAEDKLRLELVGGFDLSFLGPMPNTSGQQTLHQRSELPLIVGETEHGPVSLLNCLSLGSGSYQPTFRNFFETKAGIKSPDYHRFSADTGLIGTLLDSPDQENFTQLRLLIENLLPFVGTMPTVAYQNEARTEVQLEEVQSTPVSDFDGLSFKISFEQTSFYEERTPNRFDILSRLTPAITVTSSEPTSYAKLDKYTKPLMDLLTIAAGKPCGTLVETLDENIRDADSVWVVENKIHKADPSKEYEGTRGYRFTCDDLPFDELVGKWLKLRGDLGSTIDLMLAPMYNPNSYVQEKLLDVAAAAETFHTRLYDFRPRPDDEFEALLKSMLCCVYNDDDKQWITSRFSNTPSFAKRMRGLLEEPDQDAIKIVVPKRSEWVSQMTKTRNILAHGSSETLPVDLDTSIMMQQANLVLVLNVMQQLGIGSGRQVQVASDEQLAHLRKQKDVRALLDS